jgi:hypothetical protein
MSISDSIKRLFRRRPLSAEELAARAEAEIEREKVLREAASDTFQADMQNQPPV